MDAVISAHVLRWVDFVECGGLGLYHLYFIWGDFPALGFGALVCAGLVCVYW